MSAEEAVIVRAALPRGDAGEVIDALVTLEDQLTEAIALAHAGEFDGNEVGQGELKLYMYGPDAERLFATVEPVLRSALLTRAALVTVRQGPPGSPSREVCLSR
jgi:hypothetical protein